MELTKEEGVAEVIAVEKKNVNMGNSVTMDHCFGEEKKQETTKRRKTPRWLLCSFKKGKTHYMKSKIYLRQQLLKDSFIAERYGKGLLVQLKNEVMYTILMDKAFVKDEDRAFQKNRTL